MLVWGKPPTKAFREVSEVGKNLFVLQEKMLSEMRAVSTLEQQPLQEQKTRHHDRVKHVRARQEEQSECKAEPPQVV